MLKISQLPVSLDAKQRSQRGGECRAAVSIAAICALLGTPLQVAAQAVPSDELRALIPDSAVEDPDAWALEEELPPEEPPIEASTGLDSDGSSLPGDSTVSDPALATSEAETGEGAPSASSSDSVNEDGAVPVSAGTGSVSPELPSEELILPETPMIPMPGITVPWPDELELPEYQPLEPDPSVEEAERNAPPLTSFSEGEVILVGDGVEINLPGSATNFPVRDDFIERFQSLSSINALDNDDPNIAQLRARARQDEELLNSLLRIYGYYDGLVIRSITGAKADDPDPAKGAVVRFDVRPGARYTFGDVDLGKLESAPDGAKLREAFAIQPGDPVSSDAIVQQQANLQQALQEDGYPFYNMGEAELLIDHDREEGDLSLPVDPNGKYAFGKINSLQPDFISSEHLQNMARFDPGDVYQQSRVDDLRQAILATGLVSTVQITPRRQPSLVEIGRAAANADPEGASDLTRAISNYELGRAALDIDLTPAPLRTISGQIGYGTQEGFRIQGYWENRNLFPSEGLLRVRGVLGTEEQLAGVTYRKNNFHGRDKILTFDAYGRASRTDAYEAQTLSLSGDFERNSTVIYQKRFSYGVGFELQATRERERNAPDTQSQDYLIASLNGRVLYDTSDSLLNPTRGFRLGAQISPEVSRRSGQTQQYNKVQLDGTFYRQVNDKVIVAGRTALGTVFGADIDNIAPSRRFYAGGGSSVRGYGYQAIGPRDAAGEAVGGRSLAEFAIEARVKTKYFDGALSVVPFLDAGTVGPDATPDLGDLQFGLGVGVRYETGFGPIRVDVGTPLNPGPGDGPIAVYVSLGQAF